MRATDAPGTNVSWVIRRFSSIVQRRRVLTSPNTCFEVSTYPSWTLTLVSTKGIFLTYRRLVETAINRRLRQLKSGNFPRSHCGRRLREAQEWPALQPHQQRCHSLLRCRRESTRVLNRMRHPALPAVQEINSRGLDEPRLRHLPMLPGEPEA